jgi:hypothetical protein
VIEVLHEQKNIASGLGLVGGSNSYLRYSDHPPPIVIQPAPGNLITSDLWPAAPVLAALVPASIGMSPMQNRVAEAIRGSKWSG